MSCEMAQVCYFTIQGAVDAAINGDQVLVAPGTYVEHIDFSGKAITVYQDACAMDEETGSRVRLVYIRLPR